MLNRRFDPILFEVLWNRMVSITEEQARTMMRTGLTNILSDAGDLSACLFDGKGRMIAQATIGTPGHINSLATGIRHFLSHHPPEALRRGDVLISNNAYDLSGHLYDFSIITPAFRGKDIVGYFGSTCHVLDIGGRGLTTEGQSIFEEGLYIPYLKYFREGRISEDIQAIIAANSREPEKVLGDLRAQVIANEVAVRRLVETLDEFKLEEIVTLGDEITDASETSMRAAIRDLPDGTYSNEVFSDGFDGPIRVRCDLTIRDDEISVDFTGSSPASPRGINVCLNFTKAYTFFPISAVLVPDTPHNEGSFRPIHVSAPGDSILNAHFPQPTVARHSVSHFVAECVMGALYEIAPSRVIAESASATYPIVVMGEGREGRPYSTLVFTHGGMGARADKDGLSATPFPAGARGTPVEIVESNAPVIIHEYGLRPDSGGPGRYRGGLGQIVRFGVNTGKPYRFPALLDRTQYAARGLDGGHEGAIGKVLLNGTEALSSKGAYQLAPDDTVTFHIPGGGGVGRPNLREPESVLRDVVLGYVSPETARNIYQVVLESDDNGNWGLDADATEILRRGTTKGQVQAYA